MPLYVRSINLSLSLEDDPAIVEAVREAGANGIKVVMATGTSMATPIATALGLDGHAPAERSPSPAMWTR